MQGKIEKRFQIGDDKMAGVYQTKQKDIIYAYFAEHQGESFSAKEIYAACKQSGTPVGLATVYRQLECLCEEMKIKKILSDDNTAVRFQLLSVTHHSDSFFLKCSGCGELTAADCGLLENMARHMLKQHGFWIDSTRSVLYGRCGKCELH